MREPKCALNLPSVIGQTLPSPVANPGPSGIGPQSRRPTSPLPVVMVSLFSLGGTYSTALFAMMSTPECLKPSVWAFLWLATRLLTSWSLLAFVLEPSKLPGVQASQPSAYDASSRNVGFRTFTELRPLKPKRLAGYRIARDQSGAIGGNFARDRCRGHESTCARILVPPAADMILPSPRRQSPQHLGKRTQRGRTLGA